MRKTNWKPQKEKFTKCMAPRCEAEEFKIGGHTLNLCHEHYLKLPPNDRKVWATTGTESKEHELATNLIMAFLESKRVVCRHHRFFKMACDLCGRKGK